MAFVESLLTLQPVTFAGGGVPLAGLHLRADETIPGIPSLRPSAIALRDQSRDERVDSAGRLPEAPHTALLGDTSAVITRIAAPGGISVHATGFGEVFISTDGRQIIWRPGHNGARQRPELILGPGLVLALALQGTFCLHASAVLTPEGAVLFAGPSGAGKSALAARLAAHHGLQRLTDDITPFAVDGSGAFLLPHFPQLKLPLESQYPADASPRYPIARLYLLTECDAEAPVREDPVSPSVAALAACGHAVASRLFPEHVTAALLHASASLVEHTQVRHLHYPKRHGSIAEVARLASAP